LPSYSAAKGGIISLSRVTAAEYADKNIRVNVIIPGYISTPMLMDYLETSPEVKKRVLDGMPQHRIGKPEEVAWAAVFLASDESSHITGAELAIDGCLTAWSHTL
jgi:NAD(P)-dependent dehydrogenase (short-subunit alcohol dehydrogenase family)